MLLLPRGSTSSVSVFNQDGQSGSEVNRKHLVGGDLINHQS